MRHALAGTPGSLQGGRTSRGRPEEDLKGDRGADAAQGPRATFPGERRPDPDPTSPLFPTKACCVSVQGPFPWSLVWVTLDTRAGGCGGL